MQIEESKKKYEVHVCPVGSYIILHLQYFLALSEESKKKYEVHGCTVGSYVTLHLQSAYEAESHVENQFSDMSSKKILNQSIYPQNDLSEIKFIVHAIFYN